MGNLRKGKLFEVGHCTGHGIGRRLFGAFWHRGSCDAASDQSSSTFMFIIESYSLMLERKLFDINGFLIFFCCNITCAWARPRASSTRRPKI